MGERESVNALREAGSPKAALRLMAHVAAAGELWAGRIRADPTPVVVWPEWTLDEVAREIHRLGRAWPAMVSAFSPADLAQRVPYVNSKGETWSTAVDDILVHVVLHSSYHRGQVAQVLRAGGAVPPYTDYAHCVRNDFI